MTSVVAELAWGKGTRALGLDSRRQQARIGPSAFDVAPDGSVVVLDQEALVPIELDDVVPGQWLHEQVLRADARADARGDRRK